MNGIIVIDKPCGYTSFDIVAVMRRLSKEKKAGHTGTLDPMATGVLPVLFGSATKYQRFMKEYDKVYDAEIKLGITTDTQDTTGKILSRRQVNINNIDLKKILNSFIGSINQIPPMYSAIKKDGRKLYELAREGKETEREPRCIFIRDIELVGFNSKQNTANIKVRCSKGTYIRTLCEDIGNKLGCGAAMSKLRRMESNGFCISDAVTLDEAKELASSCELSKVLIGPERIFSHLKRTSVTYPQAVRFVNGGGLMLSRLSDIENSDNETNIRVCYEEKFIGLGYINTEKEEMSVLKIFERDV